jgi:hypothetical protein
MDTRIAWNLSRVVVVLTAALSACGGMEEPVAERAALARQPLWPPDPDPTGGSTGDPGGSTTVSGGGTGTPRPSPSPGWTPFTSDEDAISHAICPAGQVMNGFNCTGSYCDNLQLHCIPMPYGVATTDTYSTNWFSEEYPARGVCGPGYWVTGIRCSGSYCDNIQLVCTRFITPNGGDACSDTFRFSEETGPVVFTDPVRGAVCFGSYCDDMAFVTCLP